jgi:hypothetical protein
MKGCRLHLIQSHLDQFIWRKNNKVDRITAYFKKLDHIFLICDQCAIIRDQFFFSIFIKYVTNKLMIYEIYMIVIRVITNNNMSKNCEKERF